MLSPSLPGPRLSLPQAPHSSWAEASELGAQRVSRVVQRGGNERALRGAATFTHSPAVSAAQRLCTVVLIP